MAVKRKSFTGYRNSGALTGVWKVLEEAKEPLSCEEILKRMDEKSYPYPSRMSRPSNLMHRVRDDIQRRKDGAVLQITGYYQLALKEWGLPAFNEDEYREKIRTELKEKQEQLEKSKPLSITKAIIQVLEEKGEPMRIKEIFAGVLEKNVVFHTKTPYKTVNSNITWEILNKGDKSRFVRLSKGVMGLRKWYEDSEK